MQLLWHISYGCLSRTGVAAFINGGPVATISQAQKLTTKSTCGAEFITLTEAAAWALFIREFLLYQGDTVPCITLYCDNQSVIDLLKANHCGIKGTKHLKVRYFFVRQHIESGEIVVKWCPTEDMVADIMTKQLTGQLFKDMRDKIVHDMYVDPK